MGGFSEGARNSARLQGSRTEVELRYKSQSVRERSPNEGEIRNSVIVAPQAPRRGAGEGERRGDATESRISARDPITTAAPTVNREEISALENIGNHAYGPRVLPEQRIHAGFAWGVERFSLGGAEWSRLPADRVIKLRHVCFIK